MTHPTATMIATANKCTRFCGSLDRMSMMHQLGHHDVLVGEDEWKGSYRRCSKTNNGEDTNKQITCNVSHFVFIRFCSDCVSCATYNGTWMDKNK